jgi:small-conductance mechanosensitive channel
MSFSARFAALAFAALVSFGGVLFSGSGGAFANEPDARKPLDTVRIELERIEAASGREGLAGDALSGLRQEVEHQADQLRKLAIESEPQVKALEDRQKQLGPKPDAGKGESEGPEIVKEREDIAQKLGLASADYKQAKVLLVRSEQLSDRLLERRRDLFAKQLFQRSLSLFDPALWLGVVDATPGLMRGINFLLSDWLKVLWDKPLAAIAAFAGVVLIVSLYRTVRRRSLSLLGLRANFEEGAAPSQILISLHAALAAFVDIVLFVVASFLVLGLFDLLALLPQRVATVAFGIVGGFVSFVALRSLYRAILAPSAPSWRIVPLSDKVAARIYIMLVWAGAVTGITFAIQKLNATIVSPLPVTVMLSAVSALLFAGVLVAGLMAVGDQLEAEQEEAEAEADMPGAQVLTQPGLVRWGRLGLWCVSLLIMIGVSVGYAAFASFLAWQSVWFMIVTAVLLLLLRIIDEGFSLATQPNSPVTRRLAKATGVQPTSVAQIGIVGSGVLRLLVMVIASFMVIAPWGIESHDAFGWARAAFFGLQVGGITISLASLLGAIILFIICLVLTRGVQRWLDEKLLPATRMDAGLRNSIRTGFGYIGTIIAAAVAFSYMGLDVQNFAIVAGALSVGIGFGLQSIVANFVSGLILLVERPVKSGDWIVVGDQEGYVKRINVRSTEIETFDRAVVIVPNSNLVSGTVKNWMHNDQFGRLRVKIGVGRANDAEKVRAMLIEIALGHPQVLKKPAAKVFLLDIKKDALEFELTCTVSNVDKAYGVRSDLRFAILKRFDQEEVSFS